MLEVLIAIVVIAFGLLGVAGLQVLALKNNQSASSRLIATTLANDMVDRSRRTRWARATGIITARIRPHTPRRWRNVSRTGMHSRTARTERPFRMGRARGGSAAGRHAIVCLDSTPDGRWPWRQHPHATLLQARRSTRSRSGGTTTVIREEIQARHNVSPGRSIHEIFPARPWIHIGRAHGRDRDRPLPDNRHRLLFINSRTAYNTTDKVRMQENMRFAYQVLVRTVHLTAYRSSPNTFATGEWGLFTGPAIALDGTNDNVNGSDTLTVRYQGSGAPGAPDGSIMSIVPGRRSPRTRSSRTFSPYVPGKTAASRCGVTAALSALGR